MSLVKAVQTTVAALETGQGPTDLDQALAELAVVFARELDGVRAVSARADTALEIALSIRSEDETLIEHLESLRAKLAERTALDRIGARLLGSLVELGATPKARGAAKGSAPALAERGALGVLRGLTG